MGKPKVLSTRPLFPEARAILDENFQMDYWTPAERISRAELLKRVSDKDALVCLLTEKVDNELLSASPNLRIAATVSVGHDNIDVAACTAHKVIATNTPGVLDETTADFAWTLLMAIARRVGEHVDDEQATEGVRERGGSLGRILVEVDDSACQPVHGFLSVLDDRRRLSVQPRRFK